MGCKYLKRVVYCSVFLYDNVVGFVYIGVYYFFYYLIVY